MGLRAPRAQAHGRLCPAEAARGRRAPRTSSWRPAARPDRRVGSRRAGPRGCSRVDRNRPIRRPTRRRRALAGRPGHRPRDPRAPAAAWPQRWPVPTSQWAGRTLRSGGACATCRAAIEVQKLPRRQVHGRARQVRFTAARGNSGSLPRAAIRAPPRGMMPTSRVENRRPVSPCGVPGTTCPSAARATSSPTGSETRARPTLHPRRASTFGSARCRVHATRASSPRPAQIFTATRSCRRAGMSSIATSAAVRHATACAPGPAPHPGRSRSSIPTTSRPAPREGGQGRSAVSRGVAPGSRRPVAWPQPSCRAQGPRPGPRRA